MEPILDLIDTEVGKDKTARKHIRAIEEWINAYMRTRVNTALGGYSHNPLESAVNATTPGIDAMEGFTVQTAKRDDTAHVLPPSDIPPKGTVKEKEPRSEEYVLVRDASEMGWASVRREFVDEFCEALRTTPIWPTES